ncbi:MAG: hypothetical protein H0X39_16325 [Actinobacteria bacterium]|nr:hypothetical protein [Actinomycetota bacterium]
MATDALLDNSDGFDDDLDDYFDDEYVFEPSAWDIAFRIGIGADPDTDPHALDELIDAMLVHAEGPLLERLTDAAVGRVWDDELEGLVRAGLVKLSQQDDEWGPAAAAALVEFDRAPAAAEVSREVVISLAMELGQADHPVFFCLCCIDETLSQHDPAERRALARRAAILARRNAAVPPAEIQAALAAVGATPPAVRLATDERRTAVRARLGRLAEFGRDSLPPLAAELRALADEPLPVRPEDDDVWEEVCTLLLAKVARPELN